MEAAVCKTYFEEMHTNPILSLLVFSEKQLFVTNNEAAVRQFPLTSCKWKGNFFWSDCKKKTCSI